MISFSLCVCECENSQLGQSFTQSISRCICMHDDDDDDDNDDEGNGSWSAKSKNSFIKLKIVHAASSPSYFIALFNFASVYFPLTEAEIFCGLFFMLYPISLGTVIISVVFTWNKTFKFDTCNVCKFGFRNILLCVINLQNKYEYNSCSLLVRL